MRDRAVGRFALDQLRAQLGVIVGMRLAVALEPVGHVFDLVVAFGVNHDERALFARDREHLEQLPVGQHHIVVGHEHLERGIARTHQSRQLLAQHRRSGIGDDEVEAVIDVALALRLLVIGLDARAQRLAARLKGEGEHGGVAARCRAARAGLEPVGHHDPRALRLVEMDVAVDPAGQDQKAGSVDLGGRARQIVGERDNAALLDADVAFADVGGGDDGPAANDDIKLHVSLPPISSQLTQESCNLRQS